MNSLENMRKRFNFNGGIKQQDRMIEDKLKSLKKALLYSYQAATAKLFNGKEFRCLINPDKLKEDYDDKILSIPFEDICLNPEEKQEKTSEGIEKIDLKPGDVFEWKENGSYWIVYLQKLEEKAYFRAEIRRCEKEVLLGEKTYKIYLKGPTVERVIWHTKQNISWNDLNYNLIMYITKDENSLNYIHRFSKINIDNRPYEIEAVDDISIDGIIQIALKEDFNNTVEKEEQERQKENPITPTSDLIKGKIEVYPYDNLVYTISEISGGEWKINNNKVKILSQNEQQVNIKVISSISGDFILTYDNGEEETSLKVKIKSL